jgi:signal transduction histidine kinase
MIYAVSHDIGEPIREILGFAQLIAQRAPEDVGQQFWDDLGHIEGGALRARTMLNALCDYIKIEDLEPAAAELDREALHDDILTGTAAVRSVFPSTVTGELHGAVRTYPTVVREVMVELVSNAARFGASDGDQIAHITVGVAIENSVLHLTVSDLGSGMTDNAMERAPQLFQRLHRRTSSDEDSVGAGLALVRRKIERCGGELRLSRPELHDGLVADVALPIPVIDLRSPAQAELQVTS